MSFISEQKPALSCHNLFVQVHMLLVKQSGMHDG